MKKLIVLLLMVLLVALIVHAQTTSTKSFTTAEKNNVKAYVEGKYNVKSVVIKSYAEEHNYVVTQLTIGGDKFRLFQSQQVFDGVKGGVEVGK